MEEEEKEKDKMFDTSAVSYFLALVLIWVQRFMAEPCIDTSAVC